MRAFTKSVVACGLSLGLAAPAMAADMVVGVPNWPSAVATANVIKVVLEDNLGLEVELQNGTNAVFFEGMDAGSVHVHPEVWLPNQNNLNQKFVKEKGTVVMTAQGVAGDQAICGSEAASGCGRPFCNDTAREWHNRNIKGGGSVELEQASCHDRVVMVRHAFSSDPANDDSQETCRARGQRCRQDRVASQCERSRLACKGAARRYVRGVLRRWSRNTAGHI